MTFFPHTPPDDTTARGQVEYLKDEGHKAPVPKRGDRFILFGAVLGINIGRFTGLVSGNVFFLIVGLVAGSTVGMIIGSLVKRMVTKRQV